MPTTKVRLCLPCRANLCGAARGLGRLAHCASRSARLAALLSATAQCRPLSAAKAHEHALQLAVHFALDLPDPCTGRPVEPRTPRGSPLAPLALSSGAREQVVSTDGFVYEVPMGDRIDFGAAGEGADRVYKVRSTFEKAASPSKVGDPTNAAPAGLERAGRIAIWRAPHASALHRPTDLRPPAATDAARACRARAPPRSAAQRRASTRPARTSPSRSSTPPGPDPTSKSSHLSPLGAPPALPLARRRAPAHTRRAPRPAPSAPKRKNVHRFLDPPPPPPY